ncbi:hypothetical protein DFH07DRAFT_980635 [Mycena maculata]|uniref:Uncharacterized protein n=1 Tax=Mycena maculata TaxID=230809 RepID=A0AAD7K1N4_9AGAR|nr:hypothetical protein DFH07DRAFT_980635 [Mycena maculata]
MSSITLRRCTIDRKTGKTLYDRIVEEAQGTGETYLSAHNIDSSFFRTRPNAKGNIYYQKADGTLFVANFIAEIGSEAQGNFLRINWQPYNDANTKSHRMVLVLRCPTGAPVELRTMFQDGAAVCDALRMADEKVELENNENFAVTDIVHCTGDTVEDIIVLLRLHPTYEVPYSGSSRTPTSAPSTPRRRVMRVGTTTTLSETSENVGDVEMAALPQVTERKVGDTYPPSTLSDVQGPAFQSEKAVLTQRDYHDLNGNLIAPGVLYGTLTEGTLVLVTVSFVTYIMTDQKTDRGLPASDKKIYHLLLDKLKILDHGDGEPWNPTVPAMPGPRDTSFSPHKRPRDEATDAAFNNFSASSPSPSQRRRRH